MAYFDTAGNALPFPLPNSFTNTEAFTPHITVTNQQTACYAETLLSLETATQTHINTPDNLYVCELEIKTKKILITFRRNRDRSISDFNLYICC